ncbi:MAG: hypothetical protein ACPL7J_01810, partial [Desulfomonilaceae bacterium]
MKNAAIKNANPSKRHWRRRRGEKAVPNEARSSAIQPSAHRETLRLLSQIGKPEVTGFVPDEFQLESI